MPDLTIRNVPERLYQRLQAVAAAAGVTVDEYVNDLLRKALPTRPDPEEVLARAAELRASMPNVWVTQAELDHLKNEGRA
jgi:plasmid stability protein